MIHPEKHYHISFPIKAKTHKKAIAMIETIKESEDKKKHAEGLLKVIMEISDEGLEYFFIAPLKLAKINPIGRKAVEMGVSTGQKGVLMVAGRILKSMNDKQLQVIADFMENLIYEKEA